MRMLLVALVCAAVATAHSATSHRGVQSHAGDATAVDAALQIANGLWASRRPDEARTAFERVLQGAQRLGLESQEADARAALAEILLFKSEYAAARVHGQRALEIYERLGSSRGIGRASATLSGVAEVEGDYSEGRRLGERAVEAYEAAGDRRGRAIATLQLLRIPGTFSTDERLRLQERTVDDASSVGHRLLRGQALQSWGDELFTVGRYGEALAKLDEAAAVFQAADAPSDLGLVFNSIGRV